jgi:hypothetical protein
MNLRTTQEILITKLVRFPQEARTSNRKRGEFLPQDAYAVATKEPGGATRWTF